MNQIFNKIHKKKHLKQDQQRPVGRQSLSHSISSTMSYKICRKQSNRKSSGKSFSQQSQDNSLEKVNFGKFYVKLHNCKQNQNQKQMSERVSIMQKVNTEERRKRQPTPVPGFNNKPKVQKVKESTDQCNIDRQLQFLQLHNKLRGEINQKQSLFRRLSQLQRQIKLKTKLIEQFQRRINEISSRQADMAHKLKEYQEIAQQNEINFVDAKNRIQKLKMAIKQNRCNQLQLQNKKLRQQNQILSLKSRQLSEQNMKNARLLNQTQKQLTYFQSINHKITTSQYLQSYTDEIVNLKKIIETSKSDKEKTLQNVLTIKNREELRLQMKIEKLEINMNFLNRRKNEEIGLINEKKNKEVHSIRQKLRSVCDQCSNLKYQNKKLKDQKDRKPINVVPSSNRSPNRGIRSIASNSTHDSLQYFHLELSP